MNLDICSCSDNQDWFAETIIQPNEKRGRGPVITMSQNGALEITVTNTGQGTINWILNRFRGEEATIVDLGNVVPMANLYEIKELDAGTYGLTLTCSSMHSQSPFYPTSCSGIGRIERAFMPPPGKNPRSGWL